MGFLYSDMWTCPFLSRVTFHLKFRKSVRTWCPRVSEALVHRSQRHVHGLQQDAIGRTISTRVEHTLCSTNHNIGVMVICISVSMFTTSRFVWFAAFQGVLKHLKQVKCLLSLAHVSYKNFNFRGKGYIEKHAYLLHT